jgi:hypothetical protein
MICFDNWDHLLVYNTDMGMVASYLVMLNLRMNLMFLHIDDLDMYTLLGMDNQFGMFRNPQDLVCKLHRHN